MPWQLRSKVTILWARGFVGFIPSNTFGRQIVLAVDSHVNEQRDQGSFVIDEEVAYVNITTNVLLKPRRDGNPARDFGRAEADMDVSRLNDTQKQQYEHARTRFALQNDMCCTTR